VSLAKPGSTRTRPPKRRAAVPRCGVQLARIPTGAAREALREHGKGRFDSGRVVGNRAGFVRPRRRRAGASLAARPSCTGAIADAQPHAERYAASRTDRHRLERLPAFHAGEKRF
jgi:hypothetical protein